MGQDNSEDNENNGFLGLGNLTTSQGLLYGGLGLGALGLGASAATGVPQANLGGLRNFEKTLQRKIKDLEDTTFSTADPTLQRAFGQVEARAQQGLQQAQRNISMRGLGSSGIGGALEQQQGLDIARQRGNLTAQRLSDVEQMNRQQLQSLYGQLGQTRVNIANMQQRQSLAEAQRKQGIFGALAGLAGSAISAGIQGD